MESNFNNENKLIFPADEKLEKFITDCLASGEDPVVYAKNNGIDLESLAYKQAVWRRGQRDLSKAELALWLKIGETLTHPLDEGECQNKCNTVLCPQQVRRLMGKFNSKAS